MWAPLRSLAPLLVVGLLTSAACSPESGLELDEDVANQGEAVGQFDRNRILGDAEMLDSAAFSAAQVDAFLKRPYPDYDDFPSCLSSMRFGGQTAGTLIVDAARRYGLNPLFLIAHLQKESALIGNTSSTCPAGLLTKAFGCGCPDDSSCDPQHAGFERQLECAGKLTKSYLDDLSAGRSTISGWRLGSPKQTLDPYTVTPATRAAAVLYTYTPWVGDRTARGHRAPFGNYLFWQNWTQFAKTLGYRAPSSRGGAGSSPVLECEHNWDCNNGLAGSGVVCSNTGATSGQCIDACHSDFDCGGGGTCDTSRSPWQCTNALPKLGTPCSTTEQCNGGRTGTSRVCGASSKVCVLGCHDATLDCPSGSTCDQSGARWQCRVPQKALGASCTSNVECSGGETGQERVCGASSSTCIEGCHEDAHCPSGEVCRKTGSPWRCGPPASQNPIGSSITQNYNPAAAVAYSDAHWDDGKGLCMEFVSDSCVVAGKLALPYSTWVPSTYQHLTNANVPYDEYAPGQTLVRACPGDIVMYSNDKGGGFCVEPGGDRNCGHVGVVAAGGTSVSQIRANFHNGAHHRLPVGNLLGTSALGAWVNGYSTLRIYHLSNCEHY